MSLDSALHVLSVYGYLVLFPLAVIEGPIITVIAGLLVTTNVFNPLIVYVVVVAGDIVGDSFWYAIGRWGHGALAHRVEGWFGITAAKIEKAKMRFEKHHFKMTALSKLIQGVGVAGLVAAGVMRVRYALFVLACLMVTLGQVAFYLGVGLLFGSAYKEIAKYLDWAVYVGVALVILALIYFFWYRRRT